jgi:hypothetical protein
LLAPRQGRPGCSSHTQPVSKPISASSGSLNQRAVGYTFERPIRRSSENQTNRRSATSV